MTSSAQSHPHPDQVWHPPPLSPHSSATSLFTPDHGHFFDRGDILIAGLWENQKARVFDTRVINSDQPAYRGSTAAQALASQEKSEK